MIENLLDPVILCFVVGLAAGLLKSDLSLPKSTFNFVSMYLLLSIGFKGGVELSKSSLLDIWPPVAITLLIGFITPCIAFLILKYLGKFSRVDSAAIAAHYGSVSAVTFATAITYLRSQNVYFEPYVTTLVVVLEIPAICVGIFLAKGSFLKVENKKKLFHDIFLGKSIFLLGGGLLIGFLAGEERMAPLNPLFVDLFKGFLAIFLLDLGVLASRQMNHLKSSGVFLLFFAIIMPLISGVIGLILAKAIDMSLGGATIIAILAASSSYIAAPAAMRIAVPEANPVYYLSSSLGVTFPINITLGIPFFYWLAQIFYA